MLISYTNSKFYTHTHTHSHIDHCYHYKQKYAVFVHKYLCFNLIKRYIQLERLKKLNKIKLISILIDFYPKLHIGLLLMFENKTIILDINNTK